MTSGVITALEVVDALAYVVQEVDRDSAEVVLDAFGLDALENIAEELGVENEDRDHECEHLVSEIMKRLPNYGG